MNKNDIKLIIAILIIITIFFIIYYLNFKKANLAYVYYENNLILTIDLSIDDVFEVLNNQIRVIEENSPRHLCSKQGFISNTGQSIICLPNKIIIELPNNEIDTEVS